MNNHFVLFLFVRISPSIIKAKIELAIYCPIKIITITLIVITPKKIFLTIGLAGFFNQFTTKSTHYPTNKNPTNVGLDVVVMVLHNIF
jgi:hypothetical protein